MEKYTENVKIFLNQKLLSSIFYLILYLQCHALCKKYNHFYIGENKKTWEPLMRQIWESA